MKKNSAILLLIVTTIAFAQKDSAFNYFPMGENYLWKYITPTNEEYFVTIKKNQGNFQFVVNNYSFPKIIIDSISGNVGSPEFFNITFDNIRIIPGDTGKVHCDSIKIEKVFNDSIPVRYIESKFHITSSDYFSSHASAYGLGTIRGNENHPFAIGAPFELQYAYINGIHYGKPLNNKQQDSLLQYHRFKKGDTWIFRKRVYASFGILSDSTFLTREALGDTIIGGKRYYGFSMYNNNTKSISYDFLFYDSVNANVYELGNGKHYIYDSLMCTTFTRSSLGSMFKISSSTSESLFGKQMSSRTKNEVFGFDIYSSYKLVYGIGLAGFGEENNDGSGTYNTLIYAKINGKEYGSNPLSVEKEHNTIPTIFSLSQNYPNPFNPATIIRFTIKEFGFVSLKIYDVVGREVATLVREQLQPGNYSTEWNASTLPSGIYFYTIKSGTFQETKKAIIIK